MLRNKSPSSSLPTGSTAASIKSEYDSEDYVTLLIVRNYWSLKVLVQYTHLLIKNSLNIFFWNFQEGVLIFATQHFITLIRKSYFNE